MSLLQPVAQDAGTSAPVFDPELFQIFAVEGFAQRMPLLRAQITPVLAALGEPLCQPLSDILGEPLFAHVARHMRRTVNPPEATWVAFARSTRSYKPWIHIRVGAALEGVRVSVFVEDDADDKARFAANLRRNAAPLMRWLRQHPEVLAFDFAGPGGFVSAGDLGAARLRAFADRLLRVKGQHASFGVVLPAESVAALDTGQLVAAVCDICRILLPLFRCGSADLYRFECAPQGSDA